MICIRFYRCCKFHPQPKKPQVTTVVELKKWPGTEFFKLHFQLAIGKNPMNYTAASVQNCERKLLTTLLNITYMVLYINPTQGKLALLWGTFIYSYSSELETLLYFLFSGLFSMFNLQLWPLCLCRVNKCMSVRKK